MSKIKLVISIILLIFLISSSNSQCTNVQLFAICLSPLINCNAINATTTVKARGFVVELLLTYILSTINSTSPIKLCGTTTSIFSSVIIVATPVELQQQFLSRTLVDPNTLYLAVNGISDSAFARSAFLLSIPYHYSVIAAVTNANTTNDIQLTTLRLFTQPAFWNFLLFWILVAIIAANIYYCIERRREGDIAGSNYFNGTFNSFWFTGVTTATVGYGDRAPKTGFGKFAGLFWILFGFIIVFFFNATITSLVTTETLNALPTTLLGFSGQPVATVPYSPSAELLIAVGAKVTFVSSIPEAINLLILPPSDPQKVNYIVYDKGALLNQNISLAYSGISLVGNTYGITTYSFYLPSNVAISSTVLPYINLAIAQALNSAAYQLLVQKYFSETTVGLTSFDYLRPWISVIVFGSTIVLLLSLFIIAWIFYLIFKRVKAYISPKPGTIQQPTIPPLQQNQS